MPYRGLAAFQPEDAERFYGREALTAELVARMAERLAGPSMLVVVGASGSGKSSLLRAGVLPALTNGLLPVPGSSTWPWILLTPGAAPPTMRECGCLMCRGVPSPRPSPPIPAAYTRSPLSPDGRTIAASTDDPDDEVPAVQLWDAQRRTRLPALNGHAGGVLGVAFSPDRRTLATAGVDRTVRLWDVRTASLAQGGSVWAVAISPDGRTLATPGNGPSTAAHLWDLQRRARIATLHKNLYARSFGWVGFGPGGRVLVTPLDHGVQLWDIRRRSRPATIGARGGPGVGLSPDGRILATGDGRLWDLRRRIPLRNRFSPPQGIATVAFAPGGRILAISAYDRTVRLWDVRRDQQLGILERNLDELVPAMAFSPMGSYSPQAAAMDRFGYGTYSDAARRQP